MKELALKVIMKALTANEVSELRAVFDVLDADGRGYVTQQDLRAALRGEIVLPDALKGRFQPPPFGPHAARVASTDLRRASCSAQIPSVVTGCSPVRRGSHHFGNAGSSSRWCSTCSPRRATARRMIRWPALRWSRSSSSRRVAPRGWHF